MTLRRGLSRSAIFVALAVECVVLAASTDAFFTVDNLSNVLRQNAFTAILAAGMTFVILTAGIDLSVGSVVGLSGVVSADALVHGAGVPAAAAAALLTGVLVGAINGTAITTLRVPAFVVTLATMLVARGAAFKYTDARTISGLPPSFAALSGNVSTAVAMLAVFVVAWVVLMRTPFGRHVYATGGNPDAAWLSGVRVDRVRFVVYVVCGLTAGLAGVLVASRLNAGYPRAGEFYELDAIAAVVVGGTSLFGGRGSLWGTLAGAFFIGILNNGLNLFRVSSYDQLVVKGIVLLIAASLDRWRD
jgi:ribose transport system permease protein